jgi:predicted AAA+ superfamily ATPase
LKRGHANLLPGRIFTYKLSGICAKELNYQIVLIPFLVNLASKAGQILDYSTLASKAKVSRSSTVRFIEILEDTFIAERIFVLIKQNKQILFITQKYIFLIQILSKCI